MPSTVILQRGCGAFWSTLHVVACSHWNSCWFVWQFSSHGFPNSIHLMFWLYHLEVCKWCCLQFWPSAAKNMFWQVKQSGLEMKATQSELDLSYQQHYQDVCYPWSLWVSCSRSYPGHVLPQWSHTIYVIVWFHYFPYTTLTNSAIPLCSLLKFVLYLDICNLNPISISCYSADLGGRKISW